MKMTRIYGEKVVLDDSSVRAFFEQRGKKVSGEHPLTSILYQDKNPALAAERDRYEKERVMPLLKLGKRARFLDIGCGIGRWADVLEGKVAAYCGVDFSESLVAAARKSIEYEGFEFHVLPAQEVALARLGYPPAFTNVIIGAVLIYLNDDALAATLDRIGKCCAASAQIYVREPVAMETRLTLKDFPSADLDTDYNAIYRTEAELMELFGDTLCKQGFNVVVNCPLYPPHLNNRTETAQRIFLLERE